MLLLYVSVFIVRSTSLSVLPGSEKVKEANLYSAFIDVKPEQMGLAQPIQVSGKLITQALDAQVPQWASSPLG